MQCIGFRRTPQVTEGDRSGHTRGMAEQEIPARSI
ncbi:MAG: hypothetical protein METHP_01652 [Methanoregula sp. SKADARSKE-2]|nr:MAG: hypothetical protein METHP_01652 [Methanoregula sp. SKADARSKE-2]